MLRPKKNSYKEFHNEKKFLRLKNSPPPSSPPPPPHAPHNVSNGLSLSLKKKNLYKGNKNTAEVGERMLMRLKKTHYWFVEAESKRELYNDNYNQGHIERTWTSN